MSAIQRRYDSAEMERPRTNRHLVLPISVVLMQCAWCLSAYGSTTFGIYDARTLAMGGAATASADNGNAQFYNSALLAFNEEIEERTRDSRFLLPILVPQLSDSAFDVESIASDDLGRDLERAVSAYNAAPGRDTARAAAQAAATLNRTVSALQGNDLFGDVYVGMAVSEPGKFQGAGFFLGARFVAGGQSDVRTQDLATLDAYEEGLEFLATDGGAGAPHPELFDANGNLLDPVAGLESTAAASGVSITEVGVAIAEDFELFGTTLAGGISFKMLEVDTFEDVERLVDDRIDVDRNEESAVRFNVDLGIAKDVGQHWRVGMAVKDAIPYVYETALGRKIRLQPRPRVAAAYRVDGLQLAVDVDVIANEPLANEASTQEVALGAEWAVAAPLKLRAGLRADLLGTRELVASTGLGVVWRRFAFDVAYAASGDQKAAALQLGVAF